MIQRVQSAYLLLAATCLVGVPFLEGVVAPEEWSWFTPVTVAFAILVAAGCIGAIFVYKQRQRQKSFVLVILVMLLPLMVLLSVGATVVGISGLRAAAPIMLPVVAFVLLLLARRSIQKDIELVRSMDRLR